MKYYRLHHNGNQTSFFDSFDDCVAEIKAVLEKNLALSPECIFRSEKDNLTIVIFKYWTHYTEMFMIEEVEK